ncbi:MAG: radical SAM protein [Candidatus Nanoarchaeia archaeon]
MSKETLEKSLPVIFKDKVKEGWKNSVQGWYVENATPGLYTLDIEHIPDFLVEMHNDINSAENISSRYRKDLCLHKCSFCFNEENIVYAKNINFDGKTGPNRIMTLDETMTVIDQAVAIAKEEGHDFRNVKFLGPGELTINPQLFEIIEQYEKRGINFSIFTKGAVLGSDELAMKYWNMSAKELVSKLADYKNLSLLFSFQSFNDKLQDDLVTTKITTRFGELTKGLRGYSAIRNEAIVNLFESDFYEGGITNRICILNAPIIPENIDESFEIYNFFVERGTPVVMTTSMVSGKGCNQIQKQSIQMSQEEWGSKLVDLYANIYAFNVSKGIQTEGQIKTEGIASYVGAAPCNQVSTGLYIRANGLVQMCPGRFDKGTIYGNVFETPLKEIWASSPNKRRGSESSQNLINNKCPAKDGIVFPEGFYREVMEKYEQIMNC